MAVEVISDMAVRVAPDDVNECDILEYALAAIEAFGWRQGRFEDAGAKSLVEAAEKTGLSLHDSIGYACQKLSGAAAGAPARGTKDWSVKQTNGEAKALRVEATAVLGRHLPRGKSDVQFNDDPKTTVEDVKNVLRAAIQEVC